MTEQARASAEPVIEASDGDLADQHQVALPRPDEVDDPEPPLVPLEADPADAVEQQRSVPVPEPEPDEL